MSPPSFTSGKFPPPKPKPKSFRMDLKLAERCSPLTPVSSGTFPPQTSGNSSSSSFRSPTSLADASKNFYVAFNELSVTSAKARASATPLNSTNDTDDLDDSDDIDEKDDQDFGANSRFTPIFDAHQICDSTGCPMNLYVGSAFAVQSVECLKSKNITHVLTTAREINVPSNVRTNMKYKKLQTRDNVPQPNFQAELEEAYEYYEECCKENGTLLIHCAKGKSRSVAFTIGILMIMETRTNPEFLVRYEKGDGTLYGDKLHQVQTVRKESEPFFGFYLALCKLEKMLIQQVRNQQARSFYYDELSKLDECESET
jgi:hypothetical protein